MDHPVYVMLLVLTQSEWKRIGPSTPQNAAEYGSQSQDCWKYVMRCATFVLSIGGGLAGGGSGGGKGGKKKAMSSSKSPQPAAKPREAIQ